MRRMYSENQVAELVKEYGLTEEQIKEMLIGKYVRIMDAPESTTLTDEQIAQIEEGVFINGTFLGYKNPTLFPSVSISGGAYLVGIMFGNLSNNKYDIRLYEINTTSKSISARTIMIQFDNGSSNMTMPSVKSLNGKNIPLYPSNTGTFTLKMVDGTLTWVADE